MPLYHLTFQAICSLIVPAIPVETVEHFLWDHINADLTAIGRSLDKSRDDVLVLMHSVLRAIFVDSQNSG